MTDTRCELHSACRAELRALLESQRTALMDRALHVAAVDCVAARVLAVAARDLAAARRLMR